tara:strand:- start:411 stop:689 length:279 start_codon:yes stop_codon:yes gene_type:complete
VFKRTKIELTFEVDLSISPGFGYDPESWVEHLKRELERNSHYNTRVSINSIKLGSIPFNEETGKYERDKTDYRTSVEWIDKANKDYERENAE